MIFISIGSWSCLCWSNGSLLWPKILEHSFITWSLLLAHGNHILNRHVLFAGFLSLFTLNRRHYQQNYLRKCQTTIFMVFVRWLWHFCNWHHHSFLSLVGIDLSFGCCYSHSDCIRVFTRKSSGLQQEYGYLQGLHSRRGNLSKFIQFTNRTIVFSAINLINMIFILLRLLGYSMEYCTFGVLFWPEKATVEFKCWKNTLQLNNQQIFLAVI